MLPLLNQLLWLAKGVLELNGIGDHPLHLFIILMQRITVVVECNHVEVEEPFKWK